MNAASRKQAPARMLSAGYTDPAFHHVAELARAVAGLVFPPNRQPSAEAGMRRAMASLKVSSAAALLRAVERAGESRDTLLAELTVGESYFFRDEALVAQLVMEMTARKRDSNTAGQGVRCWSAGCASGEEPYTLAILLREHGWPGPATILATDIALPRLDAARRGRYTRWALRGAAEPRVARWFTREGATFQLDASVRDAVEFRYLNLTLEDYPGAVPGTGLQDLILCRNVMIYFDVATAAEVARRLLDSLAPDGWLVLGASDPPLAQLVECEVVMTDWGIAYQRAGRRNATSALRAARVHSTPAWAPVTLPTPIEPPVAARTPVRAAEHAPVVVAAPPVAIDHAAVLAAYASADYATTESLAAEYLAASDSDDHALPVWVAHVRAIANQGRLADAGAVCSRALELHPMSPELHYLHATLLAEATWLDDATSAARRAIYLDRSFVMGHLLLGDLLARAGNAPAARLALENAASLLDRADAAAPVTASDGVPAARLRHIAQMRLDHLGAPGAP